MSRHAHLRTPTSTSISRPDYMSVKSAHTYELNNETPPHPQHTPTRYAVPKQSRPLHTTPQQPNAPFQPAAQRSSNNITPPRTPDCPKFFTSEDSIINADGSLSRRTSLDIKWYAREELFAKRFLCKEHLGTGNWGDVWQLQIVEQPSLCLAAKVIVRNKEDKTVPARLASINKEFQISKALREYDHPNVIKIYEYIHLPTMSMIIMDLHMGTIETGIPESTARSVFAGLLQGVDFLHRCGITHNDIKPANIVIAADYRPVLIDFGFANCYSPLGITPAPFYSKLSYGTPEYLAPEREREEEHDERLADIWSLGITMFEIIIGRTPFEKNVTEEFLTPEALQIYYKRATSGIFEQPYILSLALEDLIKRMVQPSIDHRLPSCAMGLQHPFFIRRSSRAIRQRPKQRLEIGEPAALSPSSNSASRRQVESPSASQGSSEYRSPAHPLAQGVAPPRPAMPDIQAGASASTKTGIAIEVRSQSAQANYSTTLSREKKDLPPKPPRRKAVKDKHAMPVYRDPAPAQPLPNRPTSATGLRPLLLRPTPLTPTRPRPPQQPLPQTPKNEANKRETITPNKSRAFGNALRNVDNQTAETSRSKIPAYNGALSLSAMQAAGTHVPKCAEGMNGCQNSLHGHGTKQVIKPAVASISSDQLDNVRPLNLHKRRPENLSKQGRSHKTTVNSNDAYAIVDRDGTVLPNECIRADGSYEGDVLHIHIDTAETKRETPTRNVDMHHGLQITSDCESRALSTALEKQVSKSSRRACVKPGSLDESSKTPVSYSQEAMLSRLPLQSSRISSPQHPQPETCLVTKGDASLAHARRLTSNSEISSVSEHVMAEAVVRSCWSPETVPSEATHDGSTLDSLCESLQSSQEVCDPDEEETLHAMAIMNSSLSHVNAASSISLSNQVNKVAAAVPPASSIHITAATTTHSVKAIEGTAETRNIAARSMTPNPWDALFRHPADPDFQTPRPPRPNTSASKRSVAMSRVKHFFGKFGLGPRN